MSPHVTDRKTLQHTLREHVTSGDRMNDMKERTRQHTLQKHVTICDKMNHLTIHT
ncbi:hypothetical protein DPMN_014875 [Dreissena polymorpha]|uniref:Uncharacterized protein n=1 Tax=Dreissena polymorpha TaxID=45954 RepID=A0A9D4NCK6_DREPO|nr:hypothetical protein DPMN_014875 [Dreissena polymorpha]